jgi:thymidylate synthase (FAD)
MYVKLTRYTKDPVSAIDEAASNCYDSTIKTSGKLMNQCFSSGHHAVLEFATFTFHVEGISRACLAQLSRHRLMSLSVRSQRYVKESDIHPVIPESIGVNTIALGLYNALQAEIEKAYRTLLEMDIPAEDARYVLSNATPTTLELSMNLRELIHFCNLRLCVRAQWEIRDLAAKMRDAVLEVMPEAKRFLVPQCERNTDFPYCTEAKSCGRHPRLKDVYGKGVE